MAVKSPLNTVVQTLFLFLLASLIVLLVYCVLTTMIGDKVIQTLQIKFGLYQGLKLFIEHLIPIQAAALILAYSLFFNPQVYSANRAGSGFRRPFHGFVSRTVVLIIVLTSIYTFLYTSSLPLLQRRVQETAYLSRSARSFLSNAVRSEEREQYDSALSFYNLYLSIDPDNRAILKQRAKLIEQVAEARSEIEGQQKGVEPAEAEREKGYTKEEFLEKAGEFMKEEDYFSAHYYASLVLRIDPNDRDAANIRSKAWEQLTRYLPSKSDTDAQKLFEAKLEGLKALEERDAIKAYYLFKQLSEVYPKDKDIVGFLEESGRLLKEISFFQDEVEPTLALPGISGITFLNQKSRRNTQLIYFNRTVNTPQGIFFHGIEIMDFGSDGRLTLLLKAPYGKLIKDHINMQCLNRSDPHIRFFPEYEVGSPGEKGHMVQLNQRIQHLVYYNPDRESVYRMGVSELWQIRDSYERAGYNRQDIEMEFLMRILYPFLYLIVSLLSVSMGWAYRAKYLGRPPLITYILVPALPFLASQIVALLIHAHRILLGFFLISLGFTLALVLLILMQAAFLVLSLLLLAGQITD
jgi:hypothetical protein